MAKGVELATAYVSIVAETSQVPKQIKESLSGVKKLGTQAGREMGKRMAAEVNESMSDAGTESADEYTGNFRTTLNRDAKRTTTGFTGTLEKESGRSGTASGKRFTRSFERTAKPDVDIDARPAGSSSGATAGAAFSGAFAGGIAKLGARGGPIATAIVAGGLAGIKVLGPQIQAAMTRELTIDVAQARTGVGEAEMAKIASASGKAFANNWGASVENNIDTAVVARQTGLIDGSSTEREIQGVIEKLESVSQIVGQDIPSLARSGAKALRTGFVKDFDEFSDLVVAGQQKGLNASGDLIDTINEYSNQFAKLGLSGPEALGLLSQALEGGARDSDIAADALKEFAIRAVDGSEQTAEAFEALGFDAEDMAGKIAAGGDTAREGLDQILTGINDIEDPVERAQVGVALFGTQWEDLGVATEKFDLSKAVREFGRVEGASERAADTMTDNVNNEWQQAKNNLVNWAAEIREAWNMDEWFNFIPKGINMLLGPTPERGFTSGIPGTPYTPEHLLGGDGTGAGGGMPGSLRAMPGATGPGATGAGGPRRSLGGASGEQIVMAGSVEGGPESWRPLVRQTIAEYGPAAGVTNPKAWEDALIRQIATESGGDPQAVNDWDSNAAAGIPSKGLLQFIEPTFNAHNISGGRWMDPKAQVAAALSYVRSRYGVDENGAPLRIGRGTNYDTGGWWETGTYGFNDTGKDELVLNPEQQKNLADQGIDPNSLLHGTSGGAHPGPNAPAGTPRPKTGAARAAELGRTEGFVPEAAANITPVGQGGLSSIFDLGESLVHNAIDTGAQLASMAATSAIAAGSFGAGAAAGPAASTAISLGAEAAKRGVSYGYDLAGIWGEAFVEQLSPFGAPRWLGTPLPTGGFAMPQIPGEQPFEQPGEQPSPGEQPRSAAEIATEWAAPQEPQIMGAAQDNPQMGTTNTQTTPPAGVLGKAVDLPLGLYDHGGILEPNTAAVNLSGKPEAVFTQQQLGDMQAAMAVSTKSRDGDTNNFYSQDLDGMFREYEKQRRREARTYSGRP